MKCYYVEFPESGHVIVRADAMEILPAGVLVFRCGEEIVRAFAPGGWALCEKMDT